MGSRRFAPRPPTDQAERARCPPPRASGPPPSPGTRPSTTSVSPRSNGLLSVCARSSPSPPAATGCPPPCCPTRTSSHASSSGCYVPRARRPRVALTWLAGWRAGYVASVITAGVVRDAVLVRAGRPGVLRVRRHTEGWLCVVGRTIIARRPSSSPGARHRARERGATSASADPSEAWQGSKPRSKLMIVSMP